MKRRVLVLAEAGPAMPPRPAPPRPATAAHTKVELADDPSQTSCTKPKRLSQSLLHEIVASNRAALHDELHFFEDRGVGERISLHSDKIGVTPLLERTDLIAPADQACRVHGSYLNCV